MCCAALTILMLGGQVHKLLSQRAEAAQQLPCPAATATQPSSGGVSVSVSTDMCVQLPHPAPMCKSVALPCNKHDGMSKLDTQQQGQRE